MSETVPAPPHGRYKRGLQGADFTLEANTDAVPADGQFYILRDGKISLTTPDFQVAITEYNRLCREFWAERLDDSRNEVRVAAAWGLLSLDANDKVAQGVIQEFGTAQEKKRLEQSQSRRRALRGRPAGGGKPAAKPAAAKVAAEPAPAAAEAETDEDE